MSKKELDSLKLYDRLVRASGSPPDLEFVRGAYGNVAAGQNLLAWAEVVALAWRVSRGEVQP